ncbi:MAG: hypothetical protein EP348_09145 [Alphaproteobacteria bacterium]|nr:MAG: hypothetical protein EP348_09145 [Alphaproteobacteria bacterium]
MVRMPAKPILFPFAVLLFCLLVAFPPRAEVISSQTGPAINLRHIFEGEINAHGDPVGMHVFPDKTISGNARIKRLLSGPNKAGVATAIVGIFDKEISVWKEKFSSLFPARLTRTEIIAAILRAENSALPNGKVKWRGQSGLGFAIEGYRAKDGTILTAYPIYIPDPKKN